MSLTLTGNVPSATEIDLSWVDTTGTANYYAVLNDGNLIALLTAPISSYSDTPEAPGSTFTLQVEGWLNTSSSSLLYSSNTITESTPTIACDPYWSDVGLLLTMDGTNGSTTFTDSSSVGNIITAINAEIDTSDPMFGTGALKFTSGTGALTTPITTSGPLDLSAGDFTVEGWFNFTTLTGPGTLASDETNSLWLIGVAAVGGGVYNVQMQIRNTLGNVFTAQVTFTPSTGVWYSWAACMRSNILTIYVNGVAGSPITTTGTRRAAGSTLSIGGAAFSSVFAGEIDEVRVTSLARYSGASYTPSSTAFTGTCVITVPNVNGLLLATGESDITSAGLVIGTVTQTSDPVINDGFIISTSPTGGTATTIGSTVDIFESNSETVPNVNGLLLATGESDITSAGFVVGTVTQTSDPAVNSGFIINTSPAGGSRTTAGSTVDISESNSETVPSVVNIPIASAETDITSAGLTVGSITTQFSLVITGGNVISTTPAGGTRVTVGSSVDIVESDGPGTGTIPDVFNLSEALATAAIIAAGFVVGTISAQPDAIIIAGNVDAQSPAGGTSAFLTSAVNITLSTGLPSLTVPDLFGLTQTDAINLLLSLGLVPGAIGSAPSKFVPPGEVQAQNPNAGIAVAAGTVVGFVLSLGTPVAGTLFDFETTVISQYANSPTILQLCNNLNQYIDQSANFANFFNFVWNVDTAVGFGLDIWGKIVGVSRLLQIPNTTKYVGFYQPSESQPAQDWTPAGSDQPPYNNPPVGGAFYTGHNATTAYLLPDDSYRQLILAKAFANIASTTAPAINQILQNLYGPGSAWVLNTGPMAISYNLSFTPTAIQLAILEQSGVIPTPPGVSVVINTNV